MINVYLGYNYLKYKTNKRKSNIEYLIHAKISANYVMIYPIKIKLIVILLNEYIYNCIMWDRCTDVVNKNVISNLFEYLKNMFKMIILLILMKDIFKVLLSIWT